MMYCAAGVGAGEQSAVATCAVNVHVPTGQHVTQPIGAGFAVSGANVPVVVSCAVHWRPFGSGIIDPSSPTPHPVASRNTALIPAIRMTTPLRNRDASANHADSLDLVVSPLGARAPGVGSADLAIDTGNEESRSVADGMVTANNRATMYVSRLLALALCVGACRVATGKQQEKPPPQGSAVIAAAGSGAGSGSAVKMFIPQQKPPDTPPGTTPDYVPAEFKTGMARWKATGDYVDGKPIGLH